MPTIPSLAASIHSPDRSATVAIAAALVLCAALSLPAQCAPQWASPYPYGTGVNGAVNAIAAMPNGDLIVAGTFTSAGGASANGLARWNGTSWSDMGVTLASYGGFGSPSVGSLLVQPNGDLIVAGTFYTLNGMVMNNLARWDGTNWFPLGAGLTGSLMAATVSSILQMPNGNLLASGNFVYSSYLSTAAPYLATWNGVSWSAVSTGTQTPSANSLAVLPNGELVMGYSAGVFDLAVMQRYSGGSWSTLGETTQPVGGTASVRALAVLPNGNLVAGGSFTSVAGVSASNIVRWNGATWFPLGSGLNGAVRAMTVMPNGDLIVGGSFTSAGGVSASRIARWNGTNWAAMGAAVTGSSINAIRAASNGDLVVGGQFSATGGTSAPNVARLTSPCPATALTTGTGCTGSGGVNVLTATSLPWIGSTFRARATGMPGYAFVLATTGFSTLNLPLPTLLPQGQAGCSLLVSPDAVDVLLPQAGAVNTQLALPSTPALVGQVFHQQVLPLEVDLALNITALTSTNALAMTIGSF